MRRFLRPLTFGMFIAATLPLSAGQVLDESTLRSIQDAAPLNFHLMRQIRVNGMSKIRFKDASAEDAVLAATHEVEGSPSGDQGSSGRCWIFAGEKMIGEKARVKWGKEFTFSRNYFAFWDKFERAHFYLEKVSQMGALANDDRQIEALGNLIGDGGEWELFANILRKYGAVPEKAMPETAFSVNSSGFGDMIKKRLLLAGGRLHKLAAKAQLLQEGEELDAVKAQMASIKKVVLTEVYRILIVYLGTPPQSVSWKVNEGEGEEAKEVTRRFTPQEFLALSGYDESEYVHVLHLNYHPEGTKIVVENVGNVIGGELVSGYNLPLEDIKAAIVRSVKAGNGVEIACEMHHHDMGRKTLSDDLDLENDIFNFDKSIAEDLTKGERLLYGVDKVAHGMYMVGYQLGDGVDKEKATFEDVDYWRVQNSWEGAEYVWMEAGWFDRSAYGWVLKKEHFSEEARAKIDAAETKVVPAWDPFGKITLKPLM